MERAWRPLLMGIIVLGLGQVVSAIAQLEDSDIVRITSAGLVLISSVLIFVGLLKVADAWRKLGASI